MKVGVVGLGLIGGSLCKAIKKYTQHEVYGFDVNAEVVEVAKACSAIDGVLDDNVLPTVDLLVVALYPHDTVEYMRSKCGLLKRGCVVTDCAGVKRHVCNELSQELAERSIHFVGAHPMAGIERSGFDNSFADLFGGASVILCDDEYTDANAMQLVCEFFLGVGFGKAVTSTADSHDAIIAFTSQLAHVVSSAYVKSPTAQRHNGFSAGSFRDLSRVARLNDTMWTELFYENKDYLLDEIDGMLERLTQYRDALASGNREGMRQLLSDGTLAKMKCEELL